MMLVATSAVVFMVRCLRLSPSLLIGWIVKSAAILAVLIATYFIRPQIAGYLAGALWLGLVLLPTLAQRAVARAAVQQRHGRARKIATLVRWAHPFDGFWEQKDLYLGLEHAQRGEVEEAAKIFDRIRSRRSVVSRAASVHYYIVTEQWEALARWTEEMEKQGELRRNPTLLIHFLRALAETGKIEEMVQTHERFRPVLARGFPASVRAMLLAFTGRQAALEGMLAGPLVELPESLKSLWRGTADFAAGDRARAEERLASLLEDEDASVKRQAKYRLAHPPPIAAESLSGEATAMLASLEHEIQQEERYKPAHAGLLRRARVTWTLISLSVLAFVIEVLAGGSTDPQTLFLLGAVDADRVLAGEVWRLLTATFLHYGFLHLALNMIGMFLFGPFVERSLGAWRFLVLYLAAGVGAMSAVVAKAALLGEPVLLVGASGGIMGLLGATAWLMLRGWRRERSRPAKAQLRQIAVILALQTVFDLSIKEVSFMAHFFGMLIGFGSCALLSLTARRD